MLAFLNLADHFSLFPTGAENLHRFVRVFFFDDNAHADAHVEGVEHLSLIHISAGRWDNKRASSSKPDDPHP